MKAQEKNYKRIDNAYERIIISTGDFETKEFQQVLSGKNKEAIISGISKYLNSYPGESLFIKYERLLQHFQPKQLLLMLLHEMQGANRDFYLYLIVPDAELDAIKEMFDEIYLYEIAWTKNLSDSYEDNGYVITINDNREFASINFLKVYPDGSAYIVTERDYRFEKWSFTLPEDLLHALCKEVKKKVNCIINDKNKLFIDDREFLEMFIVSYGFQRLGYAHSWDYDYKDYFLEQYPLKSIEKIMKLPIVQEKFVHALEKKS